MMSSLDLALNRGRRPSHSFMLSSRPQRRLFGHRRADTQHRVGGTFISPTDLFYRVCTDLWTRGKTFWMSWEPLPNHWLHRVILRSARRLKPRYKKQWRRGTTPASPFWICATGTRTPSDCGNSTEKPVKLLRPGPISNWILLHSSNQTKPFSKLK